MLLWLLQHPGGRYKECAEATGYSSWHLSRIVNKPEFQAEMRAAMNEHTAVVIKRSVDEMFEKGRKRT